MVAFNSSRRQLAESPRAAEPVIVSLTCPDEPIRGALEAGGSRRCGPRVQIRRAGGGEITHIQIGRWRVLASSPERRLAEVRELQGHRIAVRIERYAGDAMRPSSEIWQLYGSEGRLEAAMQTTPDGAFALLTNYRTREACRLVRNKSGELETVETWRI
jgi:hypothetical protein